MSKRLITAIIAFTFFVNGSGAESSSPAAKEKKHALRPMATRAAVEAPASAAVRRKGILTKKQKRYWRPRLLRTLRNRKLLTKDGMISGAYAFLSINSELFTKDAGKEGLKSLYRAFNRAKADINSGIPQHAGLHYVIIKEFDVIDFRTCVGYCREALSSNDINAAIEVLEVTEGLYEEEIASFAEYAQMAKMLDRSIVQLSDRIYESGSSFVVLVSELGHEWNRFIGEDIPRRVAEVKTFLDDFGRLIKAARMHNSVFKKVVGKGDELSATYRVSRDRLTEVMKQSLRLRRALKKLKGDEGISRQWLEDNIHGQAQLLKAFSLERDVTARRIKTADEKRRKPLAEEKLAAVVDDDADTAEADEDVEKDVDARHESKAVREMREYLATLPDITELVDCEDALCEAETILEFADSSDYRDPLAIYEVEETLERLMAPGFLDKLELESDKQRWHDAVCGLINLLPAKAAKKYECSANPLKQTIVTGQFDSAA